MRHAVILAGGGGTRLWPMSRRARPKQFLDLGTGSSLLAETARRAGRLTNRELWVVTAAEQAALVADALPGLPANRIIAEPAARNTGPAIGLSAALIAAGDPDAVIGFFPSDHHVADDASFSAACEQAYQCATERQAIVTVGIVPSGPATGYGYLLTSGTGSPRPVERFAEKPDRQTAETYVQSGALWNAGMFFAPASVILREIDSHMPETGAALRAIEDAERQRGRDAAVAVMAKTYPNLPSISFDFGVMEHARDVWTVPGDFGWSDIGSWAAMPAMAAADESGNVVIGQVLAIDTNDTIAVSDDGLIATLGVADLIVVKSGDAVLVTRREHGERVRELVARLEGELERYQ